MSFHIELKIPPTDPNACRMALVGILAAHGCALISYEQRATDDRLVYEAAAAPGVVYESTAPSYAVLVGHLVERLLRAELAGTKNALAMCDDDLQRAAGEALQWERETTLARGVADELRAELARERAERAEWERQARGELMTLRRTLDTLEPTWERRVAAAAEFQEELFDLAKDLRQWIGLVDQAVNLGRSLPADAWGQWALIDDGLHDRIARALKGRGPYAGADRLGARIDALTDQREELMAMVEELLPLIAYTPGYGVAHTTRERLDQLAKRSPAAGADTALQRAKARIRELEHLRDVADQQRRDYRLANQLLGVVASAYEEGRDLESAVARIESFWADRQRERNACGRCNGSGSTLVEDGEELVHDTCPRCSREVLGR